MKRTCQLLGLLLLGALWFGPLPAITRHSFAAHMALHMGVVAVVAPLLAVGFAGGAWDPVRRWPRWFPAVPLSIVELIVVWAWHAPALHHAARVIPGGFVAEQLSFLTAGLLVWFAALSGPPAEASNRAGAGIAALLLTSMHMTLLGALLALTPRALYSHAAASAPAAHFDHAPGGMITLSALEDQHLGGAIMLVVGGVAYLAGGLALVARLVRNRATRAPTEVRI
jgi:putative membrane protein